MKKRVWSLVMAAVMAITMLCGMIVTDVTPTTVSAKTLLGDIDGNGKINSSDVREYLLLLVKNSDLSSWQKKVGDLNNDGVFDSTDVRALLRMSVTNLETVIDEAVRGIWIPYFEVEALLQSGDPSTVRTAINDCFDDCVARGANTVYFHVRANSDAYYDSAYFNANPKAAPLLTQGFDPLACAVELAHAKGLKIEAWVNPYRIGTDSTRAKVTATFQHGSSYYYIPTDASVKTLVVNGVRELVNNYDVDGVQFDDYFYPTGSVTSDTTADFETDSYNAYTASGGSLSIADWRRAAVNDLIASCYDVCHTKTDCVFGISPSYDFKSNYDEMYADAATWASVEGYVDYLCPQLYVGFNHAYAPFETVLNEWNDLPRLDSVKLVAGLALYKTGLLDDTWAGSNARDEWATHNDIIKRQIECAYALGWDGIALYSHLSFEVDDTRDATVANAEIASACTAWLVFE